MAEQIRFAAGDRERLDLNDIKDVQKSIDKTFLPSVEPIKKGILIQKKIIEDAAAQVTILYEQDQKKKNYLSNYQMEMDKIVANVTKYHEIVKKTEEDLKIEQQKLYIYRTISDVSKLQKEIKLIIQNSKLNFKIILEKFTELKEKTKILTIDNVYNDIYNQFSFFLKDNLNTFIGIRSGEEVNSFSFENLEEKIGVLEYFEIESYFMDYFWNFINKTFIQKVSTSKYSVVLKNDSVVTIEKSNEKNTPVDFIKAAVSLLQIIIDAFSTKIISLINDEDLANFAHCAINTCLKLQGGVPAALNAATAQLCSLAKIPNENIVDVMKEARIPAVLDRCRTILKEGRPFGDVVIEMKRIMEGTESEGILRKIATLAVVIWKDDKTKLELAMPTLVSIGTLEALECILMFDDVIKQK